MPPRTTRSSSPPRPCAACGLPGATASRDDAGDWVWLHDGCAPLTWTRSGSHYEARHGTVLFKVREPGLLLVLVGVHAFEGIQPWPSVAAAQRAAQDLVDAMRRG